MRVSYTWLQWLKDGYRRAKQRQSNITNTVQSVGCLGMQRKREGEIRSSEYGNKAKQPNARQRTVDRTQGSHVSAEAATVMSVVYKRMSR